MTSRSTWKSAERRIANLFGVRRTPLSGSNSGHDTSSDTLHPTVYIECKYRKEHGVLNLWRDTAFKARKEHKVPVVALVEKGKQGIWFVIKAEDLKEIAEELI